MLDDPRIHLSYILVIELVGARLPLMRERRCMRSILSSSRGKQAQLRNIICSHPLADHPPVLNVKLWAEQNRSSYLVSSHLMVLKHSHPSLPHSHSGGDA